MSNQTQDSHSTTASSWSRRSVLKAGAVGLGAGLLGRFADAAASGLSASDYQGLDAWAMAEAVRAGSLSGEELLAAALARHAAVNPRVGAVNMLHEAYAGPCWPVAARPVTAPRARWPECRCCSRTSTPTCKARRPPMAADCSAMHRRPASPAP